MITRKVYMDYAATSPTDPDVVQAMLPYFTYVFANPLSVHDFGRQAASAVEAARDAVARFIGAQPGEIVFTSGGTEGINTAIKGVAFASRNRGTHIITTTLEHRATLSPCTFLERFGFSVSRIAVDSWGMVDPGDIRKAITPGTILISVMHANNEIGTIQPIAEIGRIAREHGILFHTDAVQTVGHIPVSVQDLRVDLLSASAHKFYGPKGVGFLFVRSGTKIGRFMHGGSQERNRRASTHNVPGIVGLGKAVEIADRSLGMEMKALSELQSRLIEGTLTRIKRVQLNGHPTERLPGNVHFSFRNVQGERLLRALNAAGIGCSTGSACSTSNTGPSHVLSAIGLPYDMISGSLRLTLGKQLTDEDIAYVLDVLPREVRMLRAVEQG
ncbi:MAG TPA: aminotransferase class V-fold PLP-dependent enzyme [Dissulfurispiraceae bacterium]|nr:aminotransferase class V-fold PLP-dependent enzyme [Dissulfurispiraceae bacterium]